MKVILKCFVVIVVFCLLNISCKSLPISERNKDFIILHTKDTIYADKLTSVKWFNKLGRVTITNGVGEHEAEKVYKYTDIYQIHRFDRKNKEIITEIVQEDPKHKNTYVEMDVVINQGKVKLYYHDPGFRPDFPFIVSDVYYGYANGLRHKKLVKVLDKCEAFRKNFTERKQRRKKNLVQLIEFYNANCN